MATSDTEVEQVRVLTQVSERLSSRFPDIPAQRVTAAVERSYHAFDQARVRDFVEILTERDATEELNRHSA
jgi:flagellar motor switch protein FliM